MLFYIWHEPIPDNICHAKLQPLQGRQQIFDILLRPSTAPSNYLNLQTRIQISFFKSKYLFQPVGLLCCLYLNFNYSVLIFLLEKYCVVKQKKCWLLWAESFVKKLKGGIQSTKMSWYPICPPSPKSPILRKKKYFHQFC